MKVKKKHFWDKGWIPEHRNALVIGVSLGAVLQGFFLAVNAGWLSFLLLLFGSGVGMITMRREFFRLKTDAELFSGGAIFTAIVIGLIAIALGIMRWPPIIR